jgi:polyhydroxyalkanoate synthase
VQFRLGHSGHIAGIISPPGKKKAMWWGPPSSEAGSPPVYPPEPDEWFAHAEKHEGSWWPDWSAWLAQRSGEQVAACEPGATEKYRALADAPGTYVRE